MDAMEAMEVGKKRTRKRKQYPSPDPMGGIFTRRKSQIFFHSNRSGTSRPDPVRKRGTFPPEGSNLRTQIESQIQKPPKKEEGDDDEEIYNISIKDLRARRVFSKPAELKHPESVGVVESGKDVNPNLNSEVSDGNVEKSGEETRSGEGLVDEKCDFVTDVKSTSCENPNFSMPEKCGLGGSEFLRVDSTAENPNLSLPEKCDLGDSEFLRVDSTAANPYLSMPEKCDLGDSEFQRVDSAAENPNLSAVDTLVDFKEEGSSCGNPNLSAEGCNTGVGFKGDESNGENPNLLVGSIETSDANGGVALDGANEGSFEVGLNCIGKNSDHLSPNLSRVVDLKGLNGEICEGLNEENVQTTPPDAVIHTQQSDEGNGSSLQTRKASSSSPPKKVSHANEKKNLSDSKKNTVLKQCSRMKLFKAPNSFSYRRLLPYLLDMEKDAKDTTPSAPKPTPPVKTEPDAGENPVVSLPQESIIDTSKLDENPPTIPPCLPLETSAETTNQKEEEKVCSEAKPGNLETEESAVEIPVNCSQDKNQVNPQEICLTVDNDSLGTSPFEQIALDNIPTVESKGTPENLEKDTDLESRCQLSVYAEGECKTARLELTTDDSSISMFHSTAKLEAVVSSVAKGILKRNPRGCRGICNCLNCSSFRLNAGRAFEFSRSQMLDAEELVLNLRKELSNLRVMLENSINSGNNQAILPADQVREACKRAANMEDIATNRITQMNEELYIHCRTKPLKRPRVNFSSNIEEKFIISKSSKQMDQNNDASGSLEL